MKLVTEKTHTLTLADEELNIVRCALDDAMDENRNGNWINTPEGDFIRELHDFAYQAVFGN